MTNQLHIRRNIAQEYRDVIGDEVLSLMEALTVHDAKRKQLMHERLERRKQRYENKEPIAFLDPSATIGSTGLSVQQARDADFVGSEIPADLQRQWIQGTGPATRRGAPLHESLRHPAYALLSGANGWMFDGEDALGQLDTMSLDNQRNLKLAISRDPRFLTTAKSVASQMNAWSERQLGRKIINDWLAELDGPTVIYRPRALHLDDRHFQYGDGQPMPASIVDTTLYIANNYRKLQAQGRSLVLYLPKIQTAEEASLWDELLLDMEKRLGLDEGCIKTYVLVEQLEASFQLMEIRAALRRRFVGYNTGRWDYINSVADALAWRKDFVHPNIDSITMTYGYMRHYEQRVLSAANTPDRAGNCVLWQGGMEANIPVGSERGVAKGMEQALAGAKREQAAGASGKWVAHWKMVHVLRKAWEQHGVDNQMGKKCPALSYDSKAAAQLTELEQAPRSIEGARDLVSVGLQYGNGFLRGSAAVALKPADEFMNDDVLYLMEDMATGEIRLSILWEWLHKGAKLDGEVFNQELFGRLLREEYAKLLLAKDKDVHSDSKETTLPIARDIVGAYVSNGKKLPWYIDLLNINLNNDDRAVGRHRIELALKAFADDNRRITENLDLSPKVSASEVEAQADLSDMQAWMDSARFEGILRLHSAKQVLEQRGTLSPDYSTARRAAEGFYELLRQKFAERQTITTFGPYSSGQAVTIKRMGIEAIYLGGWATSAKGSHDEDPGPDLASYPLSQVPREAATLVRALLAADKNQHYMRSRMTPEARKLTPAIDFQPFIIADADTGHGGDAHVRNLIRRFVEVGIPGYHIEDQRPGAKKCGHQSGKVLVPIEEQARRLNTARFQLDVMRVPGLIVARTDSEAATFLEAISDERDHPFVFGATQAGVPSYKSGFISILRRLNELGLDDIRGHNAFRQSDAAYKEDCLWMEQVGLSSWLSAEVASYLRGEEADFEQVFERITSRYAECWYAAAQLETLPDCIAHSMQLDEEFSEKDIEAWRSFAKQASIAEMHERAAGMGISYYWDCEIPRTPEGFYQIRGGIDYAIVRSLAIAPFADLIWMETKTANVDDAKEFAEAIHAVYPEKMLAYNLSPSFNWDTTGMDDDGMRRFPADLAALGYVFNFITYGGHQIDGLAAEELCSSLKEDGMLALAQLQRKLRLVESPYRTPQALVGGPRFDGALLASSGRTAATKAMGRGSTHYQHLVQTELPTSLLEGWLRTWSAHYKISDTLSVRIRPYKAGSETLALSVTNSSDVLVANVVFTIIRDRRGRHILSVRDENNFDQALRQKRLLTLMHLYLIHRYDTERVHYVSPTEHSDAQCQGMKALGIYSSVRSEVGEMIVAEVNGPLIKRLVAEDQSYLRALINKDPLPQN